MVALEFLACFLTLKVSLCLTSSCLASNSSDDSSLASTAASTESAASTASTAYFDHIVLVMARNLATMAWHHKVVVQDN